MRTIKPGMCVVTALAVAALAAGALASQGAPAADAKVQIDQYAFLPKRITVKPGTTVTWTNDDDDSHTVASSSKLSSPRRSIPETSSRSRSRRRVPTPISAACIHT